MKLGTRQYSRQEIQAYVGNLDQIAAVHAMTFTQGRAKNCQAFELYTGGGLRVLVLPDRGMDLYLADYKGQGISYVTKSGIASSAYYEAQGYGWLRSFGGGLLTTCGLTHVGDPEPAGQWEMGLHGRISNTPAYDLTSRAQWEGDDYVLLVEGSVREAVLYEENLLLRRRVQCVAGENRIRVTDVVENQGPAPAPFMLMYHLNFGFPLLDEHTRLTIPTRSCRERDQDGAHPAGDWSWFPPPRADGGTQLFFHDAAQDGDGVVAIEIQNPELGFGVVLRYPKQQLPCLSQWKNTSCQDYVLGIEPGNCLPLGREENRRLGHLKYLEPGQSETIWLEISVAEHSDNM